MRRCRSWCRHRWSSLDEQSRRAVLNDVSDKCVAIPNARSGGWEVPQSRPGVLIDGLRDAAEIIGQRKNAMNLGLDTQDLVRSLLCGCMRDSASLREGRWQAE